MKNLKDYSENGYNRNYIVVVKDIRGNLEYEVFSTREQAERYNEEKYGLDGRVLTFRQAAKEYPDYFKF